MEASRARGRLLWTLISCVLLASSTYGWRPFPAPPPDASVVSNLKSSLNFLLNEVVAPALQISPVDLSANKQKVSTVINEFDYNMHREWLVGDRPAHANRQVIAQLLQQLSELPSETGMAKLKSDLRRLSSDISTTLVQVEELSSILSPIPPPGMFSKMYAVARLCQALYREVREIAGRVSVKSKVAPAILRVRDEVLPLFKKKYDNPMTKKQVYEERYQSTFTRTSKLLSEMADKASSFLPTLSDIQQKLVLSHQKLRALTQDLLQLADSMQAQLPVVEATKESCLNSEFFRNAVLEGIEKPASMDPVWWETFKQEVEARQNSLEQRRQQNGLALKQFEESKQLLPEKERNAKEKLAQAGLMKIGDSYLAAMNKVTRDISKECKRLSNPENWGNKQLMSLRALLAKDWTLLTTFRDQGGQDFGQWSEEESTHITSALRQLKQSMTILKNVRAVFEHLSTDGCPASLQTAEQWLRSFSDVWQHAPRVSAIGLVEYLNSFKRKARRVESKLLTPVVPPSSEDEEDSSSQQDLQLQMTSLEKSAEQISENLNQMGKSLELLSGGFFLSSYHRIREEFMKNHDAIVSKAHFALKELAQFDEQLEDSRTHIKKRIAEAFKIVDEKRLAAVLNPPTPAELQAAKQSQFRPVFEEPPHEEQNLQCLRSPFFSSFSAATDFSQECFDIVADVRTGTINAKFQIIDATVKKQVTDARDSAGLVAAFQSAIKDAADVDISVFVEKAQELGVDSGLFKPLLQKMAYFSNKRFNPGRYLPRSYPGLILDFDRSVPDGSTPEQRLQAVLSDAEAVLRHRLQPDLDAEGRRMPVIVRFRGESGIDHGGLRAELFTSIANALMLESSLLVQTTTVDSNMAVFAPIQADKLDLQLKRARLLGFVMGWAFFNKVSFSLKLPLFYYSYLRQKIRGQGRSGRFEDGSWDYDQLLLSNVMGMQNYRHSPFNNLREYLSSDSAAAEKHLIGYCAAKLSLPEIVPDKFEESHVLRTLTSDLDASFKLVSAIQLEEITMVNREPLVEAWAQSFISMFLPDELMQLSKFRVDELQKVFGPLPAINVEVLKSLVGFEGPDFESHSTVRKESLRQSTEHYQESVIYRSFWRMFESLSPVSRKSVLEFWTGMSAVPSDLEAFTWYITVVNIDNDNPELWFPHAHSCYYNLELPKCASNLDEDQCAKKLHKAFVAALTTNGRFDMR
eukprot:GILI01011278.1.p1 GENE.GILI01011278.1~~GILI01011278.1.p1  ORF type:complete len:1199 (-),score=225.93 GILI01011278.1:104-3700(-)